MTVRGQKKILLLGGSYYQIPSIVKAKELGYYAITCDYRPENPGHRLADEYHNVSYTDKEAVTALARELGVDGVLCYANDAPAPTAAYVAEQLGLPGNPYESVEILTNKDLFRAFLTEHGFCVPRAEGFSKGEVDAACEEIAGWKFPLMVKPVDSSGSRGITKIVSPDELSAAVEFAMGFSMARRFIVEEYVEKFGYQISGDCFSVDGKLVFHSFANSHFRDDAVNPYVPIGSSWPYNMPDAVHEKIAGEIQRLITLLGMRTQAYNIDARIDADMNVYLMEVGARNGGNMIPQLIEYSTGIDTVAYSIRAAVGEDVSDLHQVPPRGFYSSYLINSQKDGILREVRLDEEFAAHNVVEQTMFKHPGDEVLAFTGSHATLGTMVLAYGSMDEMLDKMAHMDDFVHVIVD